MYISKLRQSLWIKVLGLFLALNIVVEIGAPTVAYALTSGPVQPEFSSFEPVATTNMVNPFSGDFTYNLPVLNVPGPNGGGYALSLSYHSGVSPEEEASWVGLGWTLNPGAINRNKAGFPDDFKGSNINYVNDMPDNVTVNAGLETSIDFFTGFFGVSASRAIRFNNYKGFGAVNNIGLSIVSGLVSVGYSADSDGKSSWSADINPAGIFTQKSRKAKKKAEKETKKAQMAENAASKENRAAATAKRKEAQAAEKKAGKESGEMAQSLSSLSSIGSTYTSYLFGDDFRPMSVSEYSGFSGSAAINLGGTVSPLEISIRGGFFGNATVQTNKTRDRQAYGYLYSHEAYGNEDSEMDYSLEKESIYKKRSLFLPVPYASKDVFAVSGEGLTGTFKFRSKKTGFFRPPKANSLTMMFSLNSEPQLGLNNGFGTRIGVGGQGLDVKSWDPENLDNFKFKNDIDESYYLSYLGDLAKSNSYVSNSVDVGQPYRFNLQDDGVNNVKAQRTGFTTLENGTSSRSSRSSYIGYHTNMQLKENLKLSSSQNNSLVNQPYAFDKSATTYAYKSTTISDNAYENLISEIVSYNEDGNCYTFGLPVYAKEEKTMSYRLPPKNGCFEKTKVTSSEDLSHGKTGQTVNAPYGATYLLTQITSPEYIDLTMNGPSPDDFGGWTKFNYTKVYGDRSITNQWYKWRFPYYGLNYDPGSLSDPRDDMGTYMSGKKEVYYLESIETKTHKAIFITSNRTDGLAAFDNDEDASKALAPLSSRNTDYPLKKLDRIELYAKDPENPDQLLTGKPINIIHFEYYPEANELCKGIPNVARSGGKLTLKKVWFEYEGIVNAKIAPYEFKYEYKKIQPANTNFDPKSHIRANGLVYQKYKSIIDEFGKGNLAENPVYDVNSTDVWGNLAFDGINRNKLARPWVYQGIIPTANNDDFDPAAWNLKNIILPSGGQILVQYESHDYGWVQNQPACAMVSLKDFNDNSCEINLEDIGLVKTPGMSDNEYQQLLLSYVGYLKDYFSGNISEGFVDGNLRSAGERKMYFKLLYSLVGDVVSPLTCGGEYINGYMKLATSNQAVLEGNSPSSYKIRINFAADPNGYTPRKLCQDFYGKNRMDLTDNNCADPTPDLFKKTSDIPAMIVGLMEKIGVDFEAKRNGSCPSVANDYSYVRLPLPKSKKGGGIRVKRLMMYDPGWDEGEEVLFGTEYVYKTSDGKSSGVATNEPPAGRDENGIYNFLNAMAPQTDFQKLTAGEDLDKYEGPIGESLLPGASIGYSKVISKNIHEGESTNGFTINEFYTVKDHPSIKMEATPIDNSKAFFSYIPAVLVNVNIDNRWAAQGYSFVTNDMHGKTKRVASFGGVYRTGVSESVYQMNSEETYEYYKTGAQVPVLDQNGVIVPQNLGKEEEVAIEGKSVEDVTVNGSFELNFSAGVFFTIVVPFFHLMPYINTIERKLKTNTTCRIINYPSILKRTVSRADGITFVQENKVFDYMTGKPIVTVTSDEFYNVSANNNQLTGTYTNYNVPAHYIYDKLKGKYLNQDFKLSGGNSISFSTNDNVSVVFTSTEANRLRIGDLLKVDQDFAFVSNISGNTVTAIKNPRVPSLSSGSSGTIEVVKSSYSNQLSVPLANITLYGQDQLNSSSDVTSPFIAITSTQKKLANFSKVVAMSTNVYEEQWPIAAYVKEKYKIQTTDPVFITGEGNALRNKTKYVYKDRILNASSANKTFASGYIAGPIQGFDFLALPAANDNNWIRGSVVDFYSPNGDPLQETDVLGIPSAAKYSHNDNTVALIASNARYAGVLFESFEDRASLNNTKILTNAAVAHSGKRYFNLNQGNIYNANANVSGTLITDATMSKGLTVRYWARSADFSTNPFEVKLVSKVNSKEQLGRTTQIARAGEWFLFEAKFEKPMVSSNPNAFGLGEEFYTTIANIGYANIELDDIRVQPLESKMSCYVYDDKRLKLLASFDDQHFGLYYVYNAEGKLIRKMVETERGVKTITETLYNVPLRPRQ